MSKATLSRRGVLLAATSMFAVHVPAYSQVAPPDLVVQDAPAIISNNNVDPNTPAPAGSLDSGVTGVGQMIAFAQSSPTSAGLGLCTGTLINPRTVIFAAHCVNSRPAHVYGSDTGTGNGVNGNFGSNGALLTTQGLPISFGFSATNRCTGSATSPGNGCVSGAGPYELWRNSNFSTVTGSYIYNVNQIWYDPRSLGPNSSGFLEADVAIATLDTPAFNVPTWTMLFTPLTGETHTLSIGYGVNGTSATAQGPAPGCTTSSPCGSIDYRRRMVENTLSALGSLQDRNAFLYGSGSAGLNFQSLYMQDFDSPSGQGTGFDFDLFNGPALEREGTTAGGDSGGPLVVDQLFDKPVVVGVLSGGSRFYSAQRFSTYGTHNFYQPLFLFWDQIVANNPYVYATAKAGDGAWEDPSHWIQAMDPNYAIAVDGQLVNSLPDTPALGVSGDTVKFGSVCFFDTCTDLAADNTATPPPVGNGTPVYVAGGPGTENFVPDNIEPVNSATPGATVKARYFDVTLAAAGTTTLSSARTIDGLTLDGNATKLSIGSAGTLDVFGEYNQWQGWLNVDGSLKTGGDVFIGSGILSGSGTVNAPFVTVAAAIVAPGGGDAVGTLTLDGNAILSSGSSLFVDAYRGHADELAVTGVLALNGGSVVFNKVTDRPAPRHGESYTIASAAFVDGTFDKAYTFQGVLRPYLTYTDTEVIAELRAGSLVEILDGGSPTEIAFANALDTLRSSSYNNLWNLYGAIDWMGTEQLAATFQTLAPRVVGDAARLQERQSRLLTASIGDRLSLVANGHVDGLSMTGTPMAAMAASSGRGVQSGRLGFGASSTGATTIGKLPGRMSGFITGGVDRTSSSYTSDHFGGQGGSYVAMGLEMPAIGKLTIGTAAGFAEAESTPGSDSNRTRTTMAAAYAALPLGGGAYVGGLLSTESVTTSLDRVSTDGVSVLRYSGATRARRYSATAEAGIETSLGGSLTLTPRAQLGYSRFDLDGFREEGGETALQLEDVRVNRLEGRVGAKLGGAIKLGSATLTPAISADYVRVFAGRSLDATVRFALAPDAAFQLPLGQTAAGYGEVKGGLTLEKKGWAFGLSGQHSFGGNALSDQRAQADFTVRF